MSRVQLWRFYVAESNVMKSYVTEIPMAESFPNRVSATKSCIVERFYNGEFL